MPQKRKFNDMQIKAISDMFTSGKAIKAIARELKTSPITIRSYLKKEGVHKAQGKHLAKRKASATGKAKAKIKKAPVAVAATKPESLAQMVTQLKQTEQEIVNLEKALAQAVEKHARQFEQIKRSVNI